MEDSDYFSLKETSAFLGVNSATVRNWIKLGTILPLKKSNGIFISRKTAADVKIKIRNGSLSRLKSRANKSSAKRKFVPSEYLNNKSDIMFLKKILLIIRENDLPAGNALFILSLNLLQREKILPDKFISEHSFIKEFRITGRINLCNDLNDWYNNLESFEYSKSYRDLFAAEVPYQSDIIGLIYQSILSEGEKSKTGSYYTPEKIVHSIFSSVTLIWL